MNRRVLFTVIIMGLAFIPCLSCSNDGDYGVEPKSFIRPDTMEIQQIHDATYLVFSDAVLEHDARPWNEVTIYIFPASSDSLYPGDDNVPVWMSPSWYSRSNTPFVDNLFQIALPNEVMVSGMTYKVVVHFRCFPDIEESWFMFEHAH